MLIANLYTFTFGHAMTVQNNKLHSGTRFQNITRTRCKLYVSPVDKMLLLVFTNK